ncbi:MAG: hypothetical protein MI807_10515, partial [Verrucomicrobiales bacterium]|nr:hypothetical protein [Verrucomicrobiales bacterium]
MGDGVTWNDAANWSGNSVPGSDDDVSINSGASPVAIASNVTVNSLISSRLIEITTGGSLRFNSSSSLTGGLQQDAGSLIAVGSSTVVDISGTTTLNGNKIETLAGAILNLNGIVNYTMPENISVEWRSLETNSQINFPNLETITGSASQKYLTIVTERNTGSSISFPKLTTITMPADGNDRHDSGILIRALSTGSVISAPLLDTFEDNDTHPNSSLTAA